ncbi:hypothetical protein BQ8482_380238 [Mesorhizobium delmotii]|uniref:Uncharacterized protein n=1 Tax=Mesorhizobium delmotii TaxID=1631247 RepID=A0A2P9ASB1_9HYPH|nr:hypothetical protein BQ8482_380238 [Mesorhizobium delmotii]
MGLVLAKRAVFAPFHASFPSFFLDLQPNEPFSRSAVKLPLCLKCGRRRRTCTRREFVVATLT